MLKTDLLIVANQLNALAEVFDKKPVSPKALEVWFDSLREFPTERVMSLLLSWPKSHGKFPSPNEVWKVCNEAAIDDREAKEKAEASIRDRELAKMGATPQGKAILMEIKRILSKPSLTTEQHWQRVLDNPNACYLAKKYAQEFFGKRSPEREAGQDDEERIAA